VNQKLVGKYKKSQSISKATFNVFKKLKCSIFFCQKLTKISLGIDF